MLLGQNTLGKFGLGDFGSNPKVTLAGVFGTGVAGSIFPRAPQEIWLRHEHDP
jgi:hypothetical protein